jgi:hypothetical protein
MITPETIFKRSSTKAVGEYPYHYVLTEKAKELRIKYFQQLLKDKNIVKIDKLNADHIEIFYKDGQIFSCWGWIVTQLYIPNI